MYNFLPPSQTPPPMTPTQIRHERVKAREQMTPIVFIYSVGLILFMITGLLINI